MSLSLSGFPPAHKHTVRTLTGWISHANALQATVTSKMICTLCVRWFFDSRRSMEWVQGSTRMWRKRPHLEFDFDVVHFHHFILQGRKRNCVSQRRESSGENDQRYFSEGRERARRLGEGNKTAESGFERWQELQFATPTQQGPGIMLNYTTARGMTDSVTTG